MTLALTLPLAGCGGNWNFGLGAVKGGGGSGNTTAGLQASTGRTTLPTGSPLHLDKLSLKSGLRDATLKGDGSFTLEQMSGDAALLILTDEANRPVLLGFSGTTASGMIGEVSPLQTSIALLFYALGAFTLPSETHERVRTLLREDSRVQFLASQLTTMLAANPYALADSDPTLVNAVTTLRETLFPTVSRAIHTRHRAEPLNATLIQTTPENEQHGYFAAANGNGLGLTIMNTRRRNAFVSISETAYTDANNVRHVSSESGFTSHKILNQELLWGTSGLSGVVGSLTDVASGSTPYGPVTSGPYNLDIFPSGATKAEYRIHIVANGNGGDAQGVLNDDPTLNTAHIKICFATFVKDLLLPAIASFCGLQEALKLNVLTGQGYPSSLLQKNLDDLAVLFSGVIDSSVAISQSNVKNILVAVLKILGNNGTLRQKFIEWLAVVFKSTGIVGELLGHLATALNAVVIIVDKILGAADIGAVISDWARSDSYIRFDANVIAAKVSLNPKISTLTAGDILEFKASTTADSDKISYHWILSGSGTLKNPVSGLTAPTLDSGSPTIQFLSDSNAKDNEIVSIQVEAFLGGINDSHRESIGKASATVTMKEQDQVPFGSVLVTLSNPPGTGLDPTLKRLLSRIRVQVVDPTLAYIEPVWELFASGGEKQTILLMQLNFGSGVKKDQTISLARTDRIAPVVLRLAGPTTGGAISSFFASSGTLKVLSVVEDGKSVPKHIQFSATGDFYAEGNPSVTFSATIKGWMTDIRRWGDPPTS